MTKAKLESEIYDWLSFEADKLRDIQQTAQNMNNPEDMKLENKLSSIENAIADIRSAKGRRRELEDKLDRGEYEDENSDEYNGMSFLNRPANSHF